MNGRRAQSTKNMPFLRRISVNSTEKKAILVVAGVLGLGIGITRALAHGSQTNPAARVESYVDTLRADWEKYQEAIAK
jgi:predicted carbohydrate-binding protein with CBM5 and CBM33 domain